MGTEYSVYSKMKRPNATKDLFIVLNFGTNDNEIFTKNQAHDRRG